MTISKTGSGEKKVNDLYLSSQRDMINIIMPNKFDHKERRGTRSPLPSQALKLQLQHVAKNYRLEAIILIDIEGNVWTEVGSLQIRNMLVSALKDLQVTPDPEGFFSLTFEGRPLIGRKISIGDTTLLLAAFGERIRSLPAIAHAASGVERILGVLRPKKNNGKS